MSALATVQPYNQIFDGQKHYRTLLQCTARPGTIGQLDDALKSVPSQLNRATALLALALFSGDISFYLDEDQAQAANFIHSETAAKPASAERADFLILTGGNRLEGLQQAKQGTLSFPDQGATVVLQIDAISPAPLADSLRLTLTGPGIESETVVFVLGASEEFFATLRERNAEFPLGVDVFLTCDSLSAGPCVMALPRTTRMQWKRI
jgi:alpha-D-ribose 1-methylphosphonate 5-triphosphate synthase subunit PhnH